MRSSLRPDLQIANRFSSILQTQTAYQELRETSTFLDLASEVGLEKKDKLVSNQRFKLKGICFETRTYCEKFKTKNCYICYRDEYFSIEEVISEINNMVTISCKKLIVGHKSLNTVKLLRFTDNNIEINSISTIEKLVPTFVNGKVYLSKRPNLIFNE